MHLYDLSKDLRDQQQAHDCLNGFDVSIKPLLHFEGGIREEKQSSILFSFSNYLKLIDASDKTNESRYPTT